MLFRKKQKQRAFHQTTRRRDFRSHVLVLAFLVAFFGAYQVWDISTSNRGLEASAIGAAFGENRAEASEGQKMSGHIALPTPGPSEGETGALTGGLGTSVNATGTKKGESRKTTFQNIDLIAKSAIVIDTKTGQPLFERNPDEQLPLASITKVMAALSAQRFLSPDDPVTITPHAKSILGDSIPGDTSFAVGGKWTFQNLLNYSLTTSSNDGITAIADAIAKKTGRPGALVKAMNNEAQKLGFADMYFKNPTGLDVDKSLSGGYASASDIAALFQYVYKKYPDLLDSTTHAVVHIPNARGIMFTGHNTDEIVDDVPNMLMSKTGFTDLAGGNLAITWNAGLDRPMTAVVLGSTFEGRFEDMQKLVEATENALAN